MNKITLHNVGKKFNRDWIFRNIDFELQSGDRLAIMGYNGSGKSTLLQIMAGYISPSEGKLSYEVEEKDIIREEIFSHLSFAAPYYDLIDEFTLEEMFGLCLQFKKATGNISPDELVRLAELKHAKKKPLKFFSSGMKQRAKLTLALASDVPFVFLDEPTSNLDKNAIKWFQNLLSSCAGNKIVIICSNNVEAEIDNCNKTLSMENYLLNTKS